MQSVLIIAEESYADTTTNEEAIRREVYGSPLPEMGFFPYVKVELRP